MPSRGDRASRALGHESFEALLQALAPDREAAGERYEALRERLVRFFAWRGGSQPEDLADEAFDRASRRLAEGERIRTPDIAPYLLGVARNVLREAWDREQRRQVQQGEIVRSATVNAPPDGTAALQCLQRCLRALPAETRELILLYYEEDGSQQIEHRRQIADRLGVAPNALRIRLHRLRAQLEECVTACLDGRSETSGPQPPQKGVRRQP